MLWTETLSLASNRTELQEVTIQHNRKAEVKVLLKRCGELSTERKLISEETLY